jgi:nucleolar protein 4
LAAHRDKERKGEDGNLRSKGMGFVEFTEHAHAIAALRELNNNPSVFSKDRRPIVEFAIEDVKILKLREKRARLMAAQSAPKEGKEGGEEGKDKSGHKKRAVEKSDGVRGGTDGGKRQCTADRGEEKTAEGKGKYKMGSKERKRLREMRDAQGDGDNGGEQGAAKRCKATKEERKPTASKGTAKGNQKHASAKAAAAIQVSRHVKKGSKEAAEEGKLDGLVADYRAKYDLGGVKAKPNAKAVPQERGRWFE